ncbi:MAG TPA: biotin--[acetyl-CoA-carboxylase] ligase, partial [Acidobacteriota bacterium]|nr:biotin--[acetyl-CoA-carboxylase] ligase [Acidobacteriota bacterium]
MLNLFSVSSIQRRDSTSQRGVKRAALHNSIKRRQATALHSAASSAPHSTISMDDFTLLSTTPYVFDRLRGDIRVYDSLPSTNTLLKQLAGSGGQEGLCVIADEQTAGRGRHQRQWISTRGEGLYLSVLLRPQIALDRLPLISFLGAVAMARAVSKVTKPVRAVNVDIKWPNDLLVNGKKACGVLVESGLVGDRVAYVILGVGLNLYHQTFPNGLLYPATSLLLETGERLARINVVSEFLRAMDKSYQAFEQNPSSIVEEWASLSSFVHGKWVRISLGDRTIEGITRGVRADGALRRARRDRDAPRR